MQRPAPMRPSASSTALSPLAPFDTDHDLFVSVIEPDTDHDHQRRGTDNARPHSDATSSSEPEPDVLAGLLTPPPAAIPRPSPHTRHFSAHSHSQQSLTDEKSQHRTSWALTDGSHAAQTSESHPSKRPLLGRSRSSGVGGTDTVNSRMENTGGTVSRQQQRTLALMQADEFGGRRRGSRSSTWDEDARRRRARFQGFKVGLEIFITAWAAYSLVRYFLGYTLYTSALDRRILSLVLGSLSLASLFLCFASLFLVTLSPSPPPELLGPFLESLLVTFQLTPPITSFVLVFLWRHASEPYKTLSGRCSWDIDVVWTGTGSQCTGGTGPQWAIFVAAASVRLALTVLVIAVYVYVSTQFRRTPRPLRRRTSGTGATRTQRQSRPDSDAQTGPTISMDSRAQLVSFAQRRHSSSGGGGGTTPVHQGGNRNSPRHMLADEFTPPTTPGANTAMGYADSSQQAMISSSPSYPPAPHPTPSTSSYDPYTTFSSGEPSSSSHPHLSSPSSSSTHPSNLYTSSNPYASSNPYSFTSDPDSNSPLPSPSESQDPDAAAAAIAARLARRTADMELIQFAAQFRSLVHQMQRDVAAGALYPSTSTGPGGNAGGGGTAWGGWTGAGWTGPVGSAGDSVGSSAGTPSSEGDGMTPRSDDGRDDYGFPSTGPIAGPSSGYPYHYEQGQGQNQGQWQWTGPGPSPLTFGQQLSNPTTGPATRLAPEEREQMRLVLGRLVRRMPTIESLGSREGAGSSVHRSGTGPYSSASATASRPPTRMTMRSATNTDAGSFVSSAPPSRSNSLTLGRAVQGQGGTAPLPTPPSPVALDGGYFSGRASPGPHGHRGAAQQAPSRPPTPTDSASVSYQGTPMTTSGTATTTHSGSHSGPNTASNSSAGHSPAMGWSLAGFTQSQQS